jgi:hypothetical protein
MDSSDMIADTGQLGPDSRDEQLGKDRQDRAECTGWPEHYSKDRGQRKESKGRIAETIQP